MYYIYHIKGTKIGVSEEPEIRTKRQGFIEYEILEEHTCIFCVSDREQELQRQYGYKVDKVPYWKSRLMWPTKEGTIKGGKVAGEKNKEQFKKVASKFAKENSIKSRWKLQKKVYQYDLDGNLINTFDGVREAKRQLGYCMGANVRKKKKTCHGFVFSYELLIPST
jgi:hypothetical protein